MRRLLTGYAINFNKRHHRAGHLFQNRYKSIGCEEEPYLLELLTRVENYYGLPPGHLKKRSRNECAVKARDVFCYAAVRYLWYSGTEAGRLINIARSAVSHSVRCGSKVITENQTLLVELFR